MFGEANYCITLRIIYLQVKFRSNGYWEALVLATRILNGVCVDLGYGRLENFFFLLAGTRSHERANARSRAIFYRGRVGTTCNLSPGKLENGTPYTCT